MTGAGAQDNPYVVYTATELHNALQQSGVYIKLGREIDCNEDLKSWPKCTVLAKELDLNNFDLLNIYAENGSVVFDISKLNEQFVVENGRILNMILLNSALTSGNSALYAIKFNDVGLVAHITGATTRDGGYVIGRGVHFDYCNMKIDCTFSQAGHHLIDGNGEVNKGAKFNDTKLVVDIDKNYGSAYDAYYFGVGVTGNFHNSRVEVIARKEIKKSDGFYPMGVYGACDNSVFDINYTGTTPENICPTNQIKGVNVYNAERFSVLTTNAGMIGMTAEQMKDADYLNSVGFYCEKV